MEAEALHLPNQPAELALRDAPVSRGDQRIGDDSEVFEQLIRSGTKDDLERAAEIYRGDYLAEWRIQTPLPCSCLNVSDCESCRCPA